MAIMAIGFPILFFYNYTKVCNTYSIFPMANIYLPWPDFAHGQAVFPWEKSVSHGKRGFCHGKVNFKSC